MTPNVEVIVLPVSVAVVVCVIGLLFSRKSEHEFTWASFLTNFGLGLLALCATWLVEIRLKVDDIQKGVDSAAAIGNIGDDLVRNYAETEHHECEDRLKAALTGTIRLDSKARMMKAYFDVLGRRPRKVSAVSMVSVEQVWETTLGQRAALANKKVIDDRGMIERVFIAQDEKMAQSAKFVDELKKHKDIGVKVSTVLAVDLDAALRKDFMVTDDRMVVEYTIDGRGDITECMLSVDPSIVKKYTLIFTQVKNAAKDVGP